MKNFVFLLQENRLSNLRIKNYRENIRCMKRFYSSKGETSNSSTIYLNFLLFELILNLIIFDSILKVTINTIRNLYKNKEPITVLTAHDYPTGLFVEKAGIEICLTGDSLGMVALGYQNTSSITMEVFIFYIYLI